MTPSFRLGGSAAVEFQPAGADLVVGLGGPAEDCWLYSQSKALVSLRGLAGSPWRL